MSMNDCILVVDDNENHRFIMQRQLTRMLQGSPCHVLEANDAQGALQQIGRLRGQGTNLLVISDHKMTNMTGLELLCALRTKGWHDVDFVLFSSTEDPRGFEEARRLDALGAFEKPLSLKQLRVHLEVAVQKWRTTTGEKRERPTYFLER